MSKLSLRVYLIRLADCKALVHEKGQVFLQYPYPPLRKVGDALARSFVTSDRFYCCFHCYRTADLHHCLPIFCFSPRKNSAPAKRKSARELYPANGAGKPAGVADG